MSQTKAPAFSETRVAPASNVREELDGIKELVDLASERVTMLEDRIAPIETVVARIPGIEAKLSRVDKLFVEMQMDIRKLERTSVEHSRAIEDKLDELKNLILGIKP